MIWNNVELFNVEAVETKPNGSIRMLRFPKHVMDVFGRENNKYAIEVGRMTTGCEIRFVCEDADVFVTAEDAEGTVEIFRGDFLVKTQRLQPGVSTRLALRSNLNIDNYDISGVHARFSSKVWRIVFDHDFSGLVDDINPFDEIRPPKPSEVSGKKIIAYGSSITHGACSGFFTNAYVAHTARLLGMDVLCKGMGGSCYCESAVTEYLAQADWDLAMLELAVNMVDFFPVEVFRERAKKVVASALSRKKPVVVISHFAHFNDLPGAEKMAKNDAYVAALQEICEELKCDNLYYINGREIVDDFTYLSADLIHPSLYGHAVMGRKIADIIRKDIKLL